MQRVLVDERGPPMTAHAQTNGSNETEHPTAEVARRLVLEQHIGLRRLLMMALAQIGEEDQAPQHEPLRALVCEIQSVFVQHLADEEALIVPILEDDLPLGPVRAEALRNEHTRQRTELAALCAWPDDGSDRELAARFGLLAAALLGDIDHEERELLTADVIRDDGIVIDQFGG
jgi:hypothetical protein